MDVIGLAIGLVSGAVGGNVAGGVMKSGYGTLGRSIIGILGGTGLAALAPYIPGIEGLFPAPVDGASFDVASILPNVLSGGVGGGILTAVLGMLKK